MIKNKLSKVSAEATIVVRVLPRYLRIYDSLIFGLVLWYHFISSDFVFGFTFFEIMKVFR